MKTATCVLCLASATLACPQGARAAAITNYLFEGDYGVLPQYSLSVNLGDTVVWVNAQIPFYPSNYVESYGGEWKSPVMHPGDSFAFTFTKPGFYAYRTGMPIGHGATAAGTVTVNPWTGAPPAVTMNSPVDGSFVGDGIANLVQASVTNANNLAEIQYFANSNLIGSATNAPYAVPWGPGLQVGTFILVAKAIDRQGEVAWSLPITVRTTPRAYLWGPRLLPTGEFLMYYNEVPTSGVVYHLLATDGFPATNRVPKAEPINSGVFVDETVRGSNVPARFYGFRFPGGNSDVSDASDMGGR